MNPTSSPYLGIAAVGGFDGFDDRLHCGSARVSAHVGCAGGAVRNSDLARRADGTGSDGLVKGP